MKQQRPYPRAFIGRKAAKRLRAGHLWVFASDILRMEPSADGQEASNGCVVDVFEENGTWQGAALLSEQSTIRARIISRNANDSFDTAFWRRRIAYAWQLRQRVMGGAPHTDCCRVIFSEADGIPGLVVDRYHDVLVSQVGTVGIELLREQLYPLLLEVLQTSGEQVSHIYERCDSPARSKEGLEVRCGWYGQTPERTTQIRVQENGINYAIDLAQAQKTGLFLDQKFNREAVAKLAPGLRVMDAFCHVGTFGLNALAAGAQSVCFVDASASALESARANVELNGFTQPVSFEKADIVAWLPQLAKNKTAQRELGGPFNLIVLDPPAFAKRRADISHAQHAYQRINEAALRLLGRGGYLASCSCSHFMSRDLLAQAIAQAAHDAGVQLKQIAEYQQAPDHPILWGMPETHYLDFFIFQVV